MLDRPAPAPEACAQMILAWFDGAARDLPWRVPMPAGDRARRDPYKVWLSEIMLQQTTVAAVIPYFEAFIARWPRVEDLARADRDEVLVAWAGLGYYARARNLHACARHVTDVLGGAFPNTRDELLTLPGIGPYTAGAVAAIAFGEAVPAVDGNVMRTLSRLYALEAPMPQGRGEVEARMAALLPADRPGDFAEALMDLGAEICRPRNPDCTRCPWGGVCAARAADAVDAYPRRAAKTVKPTRHGVAFWVVRAADGAVLLRRRPEKGLLGGMMEVPGTDWDEGAPSADDVAAAAPFSADWQTLEGVVRHTFTHFHLELRVLAARIEVPGPTNGVWCAPDALEGQALPTVMKKIIRLAESCTHL